MSVKGKKLAMICWISFAAIISCMLFQRLPDSKVAPTPTIRIPASNPLPTPAKEGAVTEAANGEKKREQTRKKGSPPSQISMAELMEPIMESTPAQRAARIAEETGNRPELLQKSAEEIAESLRTNQPTREEQMDMSSKELSSELATSVISISSIAHLTGFSPKSHLEAYAAEHQGVDILLSREDAATSLLEAYDNYSKELSGPNAAEAAEMISSYSFATLESLLATDTVLNQLEATGQLDALITSVTHSLEQRESFNATQTEAVYGAATSDWSATAVGRALVRLNDESFLRWLESNNTAGIFTDRMPTLEEAQEILDFGAERVQEQSGLAEPENLTGAQESASPALSTTPGPLH